MARTPLLVAVLLSTVAGVGIGFAVGRTASRQAALPPGRPLIADAPAAEADAAVLVTLTNPDRLAGVEALAAHLRRSGPESLPAIRAAFETVFLDVAELEVVLLAEWWAEFDPASAFQWSRDSAIGHHPLVFRSVLEAWARRDPLAARDALQSLHDPFQVRSSLDSLISGWDASGQPGLMEYLRSLPVGVEALMAMTPLARLHVLRDGPEGAFAWAEALPDDPPEDVLRFKLQMFRRVVSAAAPIDPEKTAAWAARHAQGPNGDGLLARTGTGWVSQTGDGEEALRWLSGLEAGKQRDEAVEDTYAAWSARDPEQATAWLLRAPPERWLEPALYVHASRLAAHQPEEALALARRIPSPELRERTFVSIGNVWLQRDPDAARAWLAGSEPTDTVREQILQLAANRDARRARRGASRQAPALPRAPAVTP